MVRMEMVMNFGLSNYYGEATRIPATLGAIFGGVTGLLVEIDPSVFSGYVPFVMAKAISTTAISLVCGAMFGAISGGLLGALVVIAIPEINLRK
jgi:hypothetical protein